MKVKLGGWPGGPAPYGYRIAVDQDNPWGKKHFSVLVTDELESRILHVAADLIIDGGLNLTQTADELNHRALFTRSGVPWSTANLRNRLHAETIHEGFVRYGKPSRSDDGGKTTRCDETRGGSPGLGMKIGVPPVFAPERALQLEAALKAGGFRLPRSKERVYPLSGRIVGTCGQQYTGFSQLGERAYRCKGNLNRQGTCGDMVFRADDVEEAVWKELARLLRREPHLKRRAVTLLRTLFNGCLHRLRCGVSWADMSDMWGPQDRVRERQLSWWKKGAWPQMMTILGADRRGVPAYRRPSLPPLTVTLQLAGAAA
jgi:hypothetical protein